MSVTAAILPDTQCHHSLAVLLQYMTETVCHHRKSPSSHRIHPSSPRSPQGTLVHCMSVTVAMMDMQCHHSLAVLLQCITETLSHHRKSPSSRYILPSSPHSPLNCRACTRRMRLPAGRRAAIDSSARSGRRRRRPPRRPGSRSRRWRPRCTCPGRKPPKRPVKRPARPYKSPIQNGFS